MAASNQLRHRKGNKDEQPASQAAQAPRASLQRSRSFGAQSAVYTVGFLVVVALVVVVLPIGLGAVMCWSGTNNPGLNGICHAATPLEHWYTPEELEQLTVAERQVVSGSGSMYEKFLQISFFVRMGFANQKTHFQGGEPEDPHSPKHVRVIGDFSLVPFEKLPRMQVTGTNFRCLPPRRSQPPVCSSGCAVTS